MASDRVQTQLSNSVKYIKHIATSIKQGAIDEESKPPFELSNLDTSEEEWPDKNLYPVVVIWREDDDVEPYCIITTLYSDVTMFLEACKVVTNTLPAYTICIGMESYVGMSGSPPAEGLTPEDRFILGEDGVYEAISLLGLFTQDDGDPHTFMATLPYKVEDDKLTWIVNEHSSKEGIAPSYIPLERTKNHHVLRLHELIQSNGLTSCLKYWIDYHENLEDPDLPSIEKACSDILDNEQYSAAAARLLEDSALHHGNFAEVHACPVIKNGQGVLAECLEDTECRDVFLASKLIDPLKIEEPTT